MKVEQQKPNLARKAAYAGDAYPKDPVELAAKIDRLTEETRRPQSTRGNLRALISPVTSGIYNDQDYFAALRTLRGKKYKSAIVLTTAQQVLFDYASVFPGGSYETPLGPLFVNLDLARELSELHPKVIMSEIGHLGGPKAEFGIELLLPGIQRLLGDVTIVPIIIGSNDDTTSVAVGEVLSSVARDDSVVLIAGVNLLEGNELSAELRSRIINSILTRDLNRTTERIEAAQLSGASPLLSIMYATARAGVSEVVLPKSDGTEADDTISDLSLLSIVFMG